MDDRIVADFHATPASLRRQFDRRIGLFLRRYDGHWHIEALTDVLDVIARYIGTAQVQLRRPPSGDLEVTIAFRLPPPAASDARPSEVRELVGSRTG